MTVKTETNFYKNFKKCLENGSDKYIVTRIESYVTPGFPDCLIYHNDVGFFTVELKVIKGNKIKFSPHQIAFHKTHPKNTFILVRTRDQRSMKLVPGSVALGAWNFKSGYFIADSWIGVQDSFDNIF